MDAKTGTSTNWDDDDDLEGLLENDNVRVRACSGVVSNEIVQILMDRHLASNRCLPFPQSPSHSQRLERSPKQSNRQARTTSFAPVFGWASALTRKEVKADFIAGTTVAIMAIPEGMSYAAIAGLPYIYGLYASCVPTFVYALFGQSRQLAVGPVALVSLIIGAGLEGLLGPECNQPGKLQHEVCPEEYVGLACLTAAVMGILQIFGSMLQLGYLVAFLGHPVTSGFTTASAIIIGVSQLKHLVGIEIPRSSYVHKILYSMLSNIHETNLMTFVLGSCCLMYLLATKRLSHLSKRLKTVAHMGPLISCIVGTLLIWLFPILQEDYDVKCVGTVPSGTIPVSIGAWNLDNLNLVLPTALSACVIGYMESIAIAKSLASKHSYTVDASKEMLSLGISNLIGACFSAYSVTGSFSRSAVADSTGAQTQLCGMITSLVLGLVLFSVTPLFYFFPKFVLAAIVMNSVVSLMAFDEARRLYHIKRYDFILWVVAFLGTLFLGVAPGLLIAVMLSLAIVIYESVRPQITILWRVPGTTMYRSIRQESNGRFIPNVFITRLGASLYFANASFVKEMLLSYVLDLEHLNKIEYLVIEMTCVITVDSTACLVIKEIVNDFLSQDIRVAFAMVGHRVDETFQKAGLQTTIGDEWFFHTVDDAVQFCLKHRQSKSLKRLKSFNSTSSLNVDAVSEKDTDDIATCLDHVCELGVSNDHHPTCTSIFIRLVRDMPMIICEITQIFKTHQISIIRAQIDPLDGEGTVHVYLVRSAVESTKLTNEDAERLRAALEALLEVGTCEA